MVTSKDNEVIKHIKSLSQKKYRDEFGEYIVEGTKMVLEAIKFAKVSRLIICEKLLDDSSLFVSLKETSSKKNIQLLEVSENVYNAISDTKTPQGVLAVCKKEEYNIESLKTICKDKTIFALDNIQDPGNLGTILRTLDSAGYSLVILSCDTVDAYNPKVVRSTMGAIFRIKIIILNNDLFSSLKSLQNDGYKILTTTLEAKKYFYYINFEDKNIIVIGNEANGVEEKIIKMSNEQYKIPMIGKTESLNVAVATSIIAYERVRKNLK